MASAGGAVTVVAAPAGRRVRPGGGWTDAVLRERRASYRAGPAARADRAAGPAAERPLAERELTALWLLGRVPAAILPWSVLRHGRAGRGPGPDVREALFALPSGVTRSGAVEVHLRASDFLRHGHMADVAYSGVVLHLVWE